MGNLLAVLFIGALDIFSEKLHTRFNMKKVLSIFTFLVILFSSNIFLLTSFTQPAHAQVTSGNNFLFQNTNADVPHNLQTVTHGLLLSILSEGLCILTGTDPTKPNGQCLGYDVKTGNISYTQPSGGVLGFMVHTLALTYAIPIHTNSYINYLSQNFHANGVSRTYAATNPNEVGIGAQGLDPILSIWIGFRNIAYLMIVVVFIVVGLGIMLRIKIDPRTVMTLQNQIPKIIVGLLLITFSYAIAGLLIDLTYVLTFVFLNVIAAAVGGTNVTNSLFSTTTPFDAANLAFSSSGGVGASIMTGAQTVAGTVGPFLGPLRIVTGLISLILLIPLNIISGIICFIGAISGNGCPNGPFPWGIDSLIQLIVFFAIAVAVLVALFRFWMSLINAYITILFNVILSPLRILLGGLPGSPGGGVGGFFRDMLANLLIFPISLCYLYIAGAIAQKIGANTSSFILPMVPGISVGPIIALCAILMLPKIPDAVKEALKSKGALGSAVGQSLAVGAGAAGAGLRKFGAKAWQRENPYQGTSRGIGRRVLLGRAGSPRDRLYNAMTQESTPRS